MAGLYIDTSALGRILLAEPGAIAIRATLARYNVWWSSELLVVELRRLAAREGLVPAAERLLAALRLVGVNRESLERASRLAPMEVRSLDAIHLEAAVGLVGRGDVAAVLTYDRQLQTGCAHHLVPVEAPTAAE
jgi:uncharacterized protein with PIN domain